MQKVKDFYPACRWLDRMVTQTKVCTPLGSAHPPTDEAVQEEYPPPRAPLLPWDKIRPDGLAGPPKAQGETSKPLPEAPGPRKWKCPEHSLKT